MVLPRDPEYGLGRVPAPDPRDANYLMRGVIPAEVPGVNYRYWWANGLWADQGNTGTCVGHAWAHWIEDGPVTHEGAIDPFLIYREATKRDPWPENDNGDLQWGTSTRAGAKFLQEIGLIGHYFWAWDLDTVLRRILSAKADGGGPVVVGTHWYSGMFSPDGSGRVEVSGLVVGGHAYEINGANIDQEVFRFKNSWGRSWGRNGHGYISFSDFERLLGENGEAVMAVELQAAA